MRIDCNRDELEHDERITVTGEDFYIYFQVLTNMIMSILLDNI